jgi:hypothetical protein
MIKKFYKECLMIFFFYHRVAQREKHGVSQRSFFLCASLCQTLRPSVVKLYLATRHVSFIYTNQNLYSLPLLFEVRGSHRIACPAVPT